MKKMFDVILLSAIFALLFFVLPAYSVQVDSYVDRNYDFAQMKRLSVWPTDFEHIPDNVRLSLPNLVEDWIEEILMDKGRMRFETHVKPIRQTWRDVQFIKGPFDFDDPFENAETAGIFYSLLSEACEGILIPHVSVIQERRWQEPRIETYQTTERVRKTERRRNRQGRWEEVVTYIDMPVTRERTIPGVWLVDTYAESQAELYDTRRLNERFVAAARAEELTSREEADSARAARDAARNTLRAVLEGIFFR